MGLNPLVQRVFKGLFDRNKTSFVSPFHARRCSSHRRPVREDGSGSVSAQLVARSAWWSNGRWQRGSSLRTGATSSTVSFRGSFLTTGANFERSIARCIALVQVQDADGPRRRRWRCEARRRTLGRRRAGRQRRSGDTIGRVTALGRCERLWQPRLRGVRQLQERALVQLQTESRGLGTQQLQTWPKHKDRLIRLPVCSRPMGRIKLSRMLKGGPICRRVRISNTRTPSRLRMVQVISR